MPAIKAFTEAQIESISGVLGHTDSGLTGTEIGTLLGQCGIDDPMPSITKRSRLDAALKARQAKDRCANRVMAFLQAAMDPVRYVSKRAVFDERRHALNGVLAFAGFTLGEDGKLVPTEKARTVDEAIQRAGRLRAELERRRVHADVLRFCRAELLQENYFHAVLEATKSVADKVRAKTGLATDGAQLVQDAFGGDKQTLPQLAINCLQSDSEWSEHRGLMNIIKGVFSTFRNPPAHEPKVTWPVSEQDALDLLTVASLLHRRLDKAVLTRPRAP